MGNVCYCKAGLNKAIVDGHENAQTADGIKPERNHVTNQPISPKSKNSYGEWRLVCIELTFDILFQALKMPDGKMCPDQFRGYLLKWTNYIKGYQKRWFVLSNGLLSYYRSPVEMNHACRGTINLAGAIIDTIDSCSFVISNAGSQVYHLRAGSEVERQRWVTALELAKHKAIKMLQSANDDSDSETDNEDDLTAKSLSSKLEDLITCNNLVNNHGASLQRSVGDLVDKETRSSTESVDSRSGKDMQDVSGKLKNINEKSQLFRITSNAMINACSDFLALAQAYEKKFQKLLNLERQRRQRLEETVETLAKQHNKLELVCKNVDIRSKSLSVVNLHPNNSAVSRSPGGTIEYDEEDEDDHDEFFDAMSEHPEAFGMDRGEKARKDSYEEQGGNDPYSDIDDSSDTLSINSAVAFPSENAEEFKKPTENKSQIRRSISERNLEGVDHQELGHRRAISYDLRGQMPNLVPSATDMSKKVKRVYRTRILEKPDVSINLWSIMKNCIGKELTKIPMPVNFNEPLSMTQRLTEELEYSDILDRAASCESSLEQICNLAAFTISCYASTADRTGKPFNPLLGETYESDRSEDMGWRSLAEQVSHHPPSIAHHAEGRGWTLWQNFTMSSKFRGKYLLVSPLGTAHCKFTNSGNHYTWKKVTTTVNNIIVGKLWIDQSGEMDITNHTTGEKCHLKYHAYSYFSKEKPKRVTGYVVDSQKVTRYVISGIWDQKAECAKVVYRDPMLKPGAKIPQGNPVSKAGNPQTLPPTMLWVKKPLKPEASLMYNFSGFTCSLNEMEDGIAPTDSRLRPDERMMEDGNFDKANQLKLQLEEKQRVRRRKREAEAEAARRAGKVYEEYTPTWFENTRDDFSDSEIFVYKGGYWEAKEKKDWDVCPVIYEL
ncbi:oxysterol-binding protein 1-like isoform X2 [Rhopilema esculentum]|uniref:oxysterol-binding protein 1-like isoform X2 n=1 Tax=Rhopilema esculentum TaxID=499914 RepID=UPI0031CDD91B